MKINFYSEKLEAKFTQKSFQKDSLILGVVGLLIFIILSSILGFSDELFNRLFPKPISRAYSVIPAIEQQINIMDQFWSQRGLHPTQGLPAEFYPKNRSLGLIRWDPTKYPGSAVSLEVMVSEGTCPLDISLLDSSGVVVTGSKVAEPIGCGVGDTFNRDQILKSSAFDLPAGDYTIGVNPKQTGGAPGTAISYARLIVAQSDPTQIVQTQTQIDLGNAEGTANLDYTTLDRKKIYLFNDAKFNPPPQAFFEATIRAAKPKLEQQINILDHNFSFQNTPGTTPTYVPTDGSLGIVKWDADKYTGAKVYFEAVLYPNLLTTLGTPRTVYAALFDSAGNQVVGSEVQVNPRQFERIRSGELNLPNGEYTVRVKQNDWGIPLEYHIVAARLIVVQEDPVKLTDTETVIEVGSAEGHSDPVNFHSAVNKKLYYFDSSKFNPTPTAYFEATIRAAKPKLEQQINILDHTYATESITYAPTDDSLGIIHWDSARYSDAQVYFEAVVDSSDNTGEFADVALFDTSGNIVANSVVRSLNGHYDRVRSGQLSLPTGDYTVRMKVRSDTNTAILSAARLIIIQEDAVRLTDTQTSIEMGNAEGNSTANYSPLDRKKLYYFDASKFNPTPTAYFEATIRSAKPKLEQQINIIDQSVTVTSLSDVPTDNSLGVIYWDADKYTGAKVYFDASMTPPAANGSYVEATLYDVSGNPVSGSAVRVTAGSHTRAKSGQLSLPTGEYTVRAKKTSSGTAHLHAARLIIIQEDSVKITNTLTQIEIGNNETSTATSYTPIVDKKVYLYDASKFNPAPSVYFEATLSNGTSSDTTFAALAKDGSCNELVAGSEVSLTGTAWQRVRSSAITLTTGTDYAVCIKASSGTARMANAKLILDQSDANGVTDVELIHQTINTRPVAFRLVNTQFDLNNFGVYPKAYYEATARVTSGTRAINLQRSFIIRGGYDNLVAKTLTLNNTAYQRVRNPENIIFDLPQSPEDISQEFNGNVVISSSWLILQLNNLPTSDAEGSARLFNDTDGVEVTGSEVTTNQAGFDLIRSGPINLTSGKEYAVQTKSATIANAKLILDQSDANGITDLEVVQQQANTFQPNGTVPNYNQFDLFNFGVYPKAYYEATLRAQPGTTGQTRLVRTIGIVSNLPTLATTNTGFTRVRSSEDITSDLPQTFEDLNIADALTISSTLKNGEVASSWLVLQLNNLPVSGGEGFARLFNETDGVEVTGSEVTTNQAEFDVVRSGPINLTTGKEFTAQIKAGTLINAKIILNQSDTSGITDVELIHHQINANYVYQNSVPNNYNLFDMYNFGVYPKAYFEAVLKTPTSPAVAASTGDLVGMGYADLRRSFGIYSLFDNAEAQSPSYVRVRPPGNIAFDLPQTYEEMHTMLRIGKENDLSVRAGDASEIASSWLVLQLNNLPVSGGEGSARLFNETDGVEVTGSEITTDQAGFDLIRSGPISLTSLKEYVVQTKSATIANAKLILDQGSVSGISDLELVHQYLNTGYHVQTNNGAEGLLPFHTNTLNPTNFGPGPIDYCYEATMKNDGAEYTKAGLMVWDTSYHLTTFATSPSTSNVGPFGSITRPVAATTNSTAFNRQRINVSNVVPAGDALTPDLRILSSRTFNSQDGSFIGSDDSSYTSWYNNTWLLLQVHGLNANVPAPVASGDPCVSTVQFNPSPSPNVTPSPEPSPSPVSPSSPPASEPPSSSEPPASSPPSSSNPGSPTPSFVPVIPKGAPVTGKENKHGK